MSSLKFIIPILVFVIYGKSSTAQLIYDFNKGEFTKGVQQNKKVSPIPYGGFSTLQIININTFRYKVELEGNSVNYITPIPSELQTVFRLSSENLSDQNLTKALNLANEAAGSMVQQSKEAKDAKALAPVASQNAAERLDKAMQALVKACEEYIVIAQKVANIKFRRMKLVTLSSQQWESHEKLMSELSVDFLTESQMKKDYDLFVKYYAKASLLYQGAAIAAEQAKTANVPNTDGAKDAIKKAEEQIEQSHDLFYQDNFLKLIEDVSILQNALAKEEYFTVKSAPIQISGDYVNFNLKITPAQVNNLMPYEISRTFPVEVPSKGGLKVDFSVGPAISFGNNSKDEIFYLEPGQDEKVTLKKRPNNNAISPGMAAMMHFGPRSGTETRVAGMFGVGAGFQSTQDVNFSLFGGLSAVFGKRERIMLSTGVSYLRVSRLKNNEFVPDKEYEAAAINLPDVTEKVFKPSFFIAISYNLTNRLDIK